MEEVGDVTLLVNNAGCVAGKTLVSSTVESITETININTLAQFWVSLSCLEISAIDY